MTTMQWFDSIEKVLAEAKKEDTHLKAGIKCAAPKLRKHLRELATLSSDSDSGDDEHSISSADIETTDVAETD